MSTSELKTAPIYIVSVDNTPEVAKKLVDILIKGLSTQYNLVHLANSNRLEGLEFLLESLVFAPQVLICSSQWTSTQVKEVLELAKTISPDIQDDCDSTWIECRERRRGCCGVLERADPRT